MWIVRTRKSYGLYDNIEQATSAARKYKWIIKKIELNKFYHTYWWDPFPHRQKESIEDMNKKLERSGYPNVAKFILDK